MRYLIVLLLTGCATPQFDVSGREPNCARGCLNSYSSCVSASGGTSTHTSWQIMRACRHTTDQCLATCPAR
jgi:hypothetical protein